MKLDIDTSPKLYNLEFVTLDRSYSQTTSPRSIISKSGVEFDHFRQYQIDDDARKIDWIASARSNELLVRIYREDTSMNILLMLDVSGSMIYGTGKRAKIEQAIETVMNLAYGILTYGDAVGLMIFDDEIINVAKYDIGLKHFGKIREMLLETAKYGGGFDLDNAFINAIGMFHETHLVILVSDFIKKEKPIIDTIFNVADRFDILGIMVSDKTDISFDYPAAIMDLQSPYGPDKELFNARKMAKIYSEANKKRVADLRNFFTVIRKEMWTLDSDDEIDRKIPELLSMRNNLANRR